ncbi:MAG: ComEC/Rec2 family competence protein [Defluviitaleaceae bacterium]|nr:ComEC/Rec2 family competence protein [Defluviitaleaceae bacterium]
MKYPPVFLCILLAAAGAFGIQQRFNENILPGENLEFYGIVQDMRYTRTGWQRLVVLAPYGISDGLNDIDSKLLAMPGSQILTFLSPAFRVEIGQRVRLFGNLYPLDWARNPGGYNEFMVQRATGISGRFFAREAEGFEVHMNLTRTTYVLRNRLATIYDTVLPYRESRLIKSMVLGERPDMDDRVVEMYRAAGIYHLLVVSGLHLSILMMSISLVLELVFNKRKAGLIALVLIIGYALLTGAGISTIRAVTMAGVAVFGRVLYRDRDSLASVSFACILLLLYEPLYLFSIGFQLSFATVFGIVLLTAPTERALALLGMPPYKKFRAVLAYNIVATVSTYPVLAYHFSYVSTYSILVNMIIAPTVTLLLIVGLLVGITGLFSINTALFLAGAVYFLLRFYEAVIRWFVSLPGAVWLAGNRGLWVTLATMGIMLVFGYTFSGFGEIFRHRVKILALSVTILLASIAFEAMDRQRLNITALDMGHGTEVTGYVIRRGGHTFVIDGGGNNRLLGMNTGHMVLMPYLDHRGVVQADGAFVTNMSRQRVTGLIELAMANRVKVLYIPVGLNIDSGLGMRLRVAAERNNIPIYRLQAGDAIRSGDLILTMIQEQPVLWQVTYRGEIVK